MVEGDATRDQGRFLNRVAEFRRQADYGSGPVDVSVESLLNDTRSFVTRMENLVEGAE